MSGALLAQDGDVQLGSDTVGMLLRGVRNSTKRPLKGTGTAAGWVINNFNPWIAPDQSTQETALMYRPGMLSGYDMSLSRQLEFDVYFPPTTSTVLQRTNALALAAATRLKYTLAENEISWRMNGQKYVIYGRFRGVTFDPSTIPRKQIRARVQFLQTDPAIYDLSNPVTFNLPVFPGPVSVDNSSGKPVVTNPMRASHGVAVSLQGDTPVRWTWTFGGTGSVAFINPSLVVLTSLLATDRVMTFSDCSRGNFWMSAPASVTVTSATHGVYSSLGTPLHNFLGMPSEWIIMDPPEQPTGISFFYVANARLAGTSAGLTMSAGDYAAATSSISYIAGYNYVF